MSKGNLARIGEQIDGAITHELGDGQQDPEVLQELGVDPRRTRTIAGLTVVSNAARDAEMDAPAGAMIDRLLRYRADAKLVVDKLRRVGVTPITVLPLSAWNKICAASRLIQFTPHNGDRVWFATENTINQTAYRQALDTINANNKRVITSALQYGITIAAFTALASWLFTLYCLFGLIGCVVCFVVCIAHADPDPNQVSVLHVQNIRSLVASAEKSGTLATALWPQLCEPVSGVKSWETHIGFPVPPLEVQEQLIAAERARMPLHIATVPAAITFKESIADVMLGKPGVKCEGAHVSETSQHDPIAYVIEGSAVAIVEQFGEFAVEENITNEVMNSEHLV